MLGHGVGLRREFFEELSRGPIGEVDFFEVISENFFTAPVQAWAVLERVRCETPVVLHGVGLGLGDEEPPDPAYLRQLEQLVRRISPAWVSDHLCWTSQLGHHSHDLLPLVRTRETARRVAENVGRVQDRLQCQILLENVSSYVEFRESDMSEVEFFGEVTALSDCLILLDVNNVVVNAHNHGFDALDFIRQVPGGRVRQIHLAGHARDEAPGGSGLLIDTHVGPVPASVWQTYRAALDRLGAVSTSIEWDEAIPGYQAVVRECEHARSVSAESLAAAPVRHAGGAA